MRHDPTAPRHHGPCVTPPARARRAGFGGRERPRPRAEKLRALPRHRKTDASPHPGAPPLRRIGDTYNLDDFARLLRSGRLVAPHPDMPPLKFDRASAQAVTRYLRSIQE